MFAESTIFMVVYCFFFYFSLFSAQPSFFYEELAKVQKVEMDKREKEISKHEMVQAATKKAEEEAKKRCV